MLSEGNTVCSWSPRVGHFLIAGLNFVSRCPMVLFVGKHHQESLPRETPKSPKLVWSSVDVAPRLESPPGSRKRTENYGSGWAAELHCRAAGCSNISVSNKPWEGASRHLGHGVTWPNRLGLSRLVPSTQSYISSKYSAMMNYDVDMSWQLLSTLLRFIMV